LTKFGADFINYHIQFLLYFIIVLKEERRLKLSENGALRKIFGSERDEVTGEWRKLHSEELNALYSSPIIV